MSDYSDEVIENLANVLSNVLSEQSKEIEAVYNSMFKIVEEDRQVNCCACGFDTCEHLAAAIVLGMRSNEDCSFYRQHCDGLDRFIEHFY